MRCPHCAGEIPAASRFCGICGRSITPAVHGPESASRRAQAAPSGQSPVDTVSLFELPASRAARRAKLALVLVLDAILAGAGVVMLLSYFESRRDGRLAPSMRQASDPAGPVEEARSPDEETAPSVPAVPAVDEAGSPASPPWAPEPDPSPSSVPARKGPARPAPKPRSAPAPGDKAKAKPRSGSSARAGEAPAMEPVPWRAAEQGALLQPAAAVAEPAQEEEADTDIQLLTRRLRGMVARHQAELEDCYLAGSNSAGPGDLPEGRIDIRFTLMPRGSAANVVPVRNTTGSVELAECVADRIRSWSLPGGVPSPIELEWPFLFHPPELDTPL